MLQNRLLKNIKTFTELIKGIDDVKKIRASSYFMGAFLSLFKKIEIFNPGGCNFSYRPIDYHLNGFKEFGVNIISENDLYLEAQSLELESRTNSEKLEEALEKYQEADELGSVEASFFLLQYYFQNKFHIRPFYL